MKLLLPLLLVGCTPFHELSYDELYQQASDCKRAKAIGCDPLWKEVNRRAEARDRRERNSRTIECPGSMVIYEDRWGEMYCISREEARRIFSGRRY